MWMGHCRRREPRARSFFALLKVEQNLNTSEPNPWNQGAVWNPGTFLI